MLIVYANGAGLGRLQEDGGGLSPPDERLEPTASGGNTFGTMTRDLLALNDGWKRCCWPNWRPI